MGWGKFVMVISKSVGERMMSAFGVPEKKICLVYRGVDLGKYPYDAQRYDKEKESYVVINIGRLTPIKGQPEFIEAMKYVTEHVNAEAWIVGGVEEGKGDYLNELKELSYGLVLGKKVSFLGRRTDTPELLKESDCLVLPSTVPEGFGRTIIEAGAAGCAVCAAAIGGIREVIDDGSSGLLFSPGDPVSMGETIVKMLRDRELRKRCAQNLRKKIEASFTLEGMVRDTLTVYQDAIGKSTRS